MGGLFDTLGDKLSDPVGAIERKLDDPFGDLKSKPATPQPTKRKSKTASTLMSSASPADKIESVADASPTQKLLRN